MVVVGCDQHLLDQSSIQREPLLGVNQLISVELTGDTFMLAMHILKNEAHAN
ncbi:hypothetical protein SAMN04488029_2124 [Reichenbachiella faecimaris]|uniref:Uncharacterized protein n=1 Tax=Reichenbachiella faecimaris TaxID=692418 RepID=A0A1W2GDR2_REIFA|nr:hypothetical protein [Reichenbachiella faecimaris]SMD34664.1 hypothetical protein SAMN04488029_2124 [Reichenbachiella faecimaris]